MKELYSRPNVHLIPPVSDWFTADMVLVELKKKKESKWNSIKDIHSPHCKLLHLYTTIRDSKSILQESVSNKVELVHDPIDSQKDKVVS